MKSVRTPKYEKVASAIRKDISIGTYPVGSFLPPEHILEAKYHVSRATIRSAIQTLVNEGLLKVRQGQGTTVLHSGSFHRFSHVTLLSESIAFTRDKTDHPVLVTTAIDEVPIQDPQDAAFLRVNLHDYVFRIQRILKQDDCPFCILTNYLPKHLTPNLTDYEGQFIDLYSFLRDTYGIRYTKSEETVSAQSAGLIESEILSIPINSPLLYLRRTAHCNLGPMECSYQQIRTDIYKLHIHMNNE